VVVLSAFTQVTLRQAALWVAGVHTGKLSDVEHHALGQSKLTDEFAVWRPGALRGTRLWIGPHSYPILDNTATTLIVETPSLDDLNELRELGRRQTRYTTGYARPHLFVRLALAVPKLNLTFADPLLGLLLAATVVALWQARRRPAWRPLPWPLLAFLLVAVLSLAVGGMAGRRAGAKELVQAGVGLGLSWWLWRELWRLGSLRQRIAVALVIGAALLVAVGLAEYAAILTRHTLRKLADIGELDSLLGFRFNPARNDAAGSESSKMMLGAYLLLLTPFLAALAAAPWRRTWRIVAGITAALALVLILHPLLLLATAAGLATVAATWRRPWALGAMLAGVLVMVGLACYLIPCHGGVLLQSAALYRYDDRFGLLPMPLKGRSRATAPIWMEYQQKYVELQAAINAVSFAPWLGHGFGQYQQHINRYYGKAKELSLIVPKDPRNFMEQDAHSQYAVVAVELGLLGLAALLAWWLGAARQAVHAVQQRAGFDRALAAGALGSLVAVLLGGAFVVFTVRGLLVLFIALLALPAALALPDPEPDPEP